MAAAAKSLGYEEQFTAYAMRHAGPSADRADNVRSAEDVKKRLRVSSDSTVKRYEKAGRLLESLRRLGPKRLAVAQQCESRIAEVLSGSWNPL